jgi:hypothetical protein
MTIRVLRLIEYVYADEQTAADDMARWTVTAKPRNMVMRSAVLPFEAWPDWPGLAECKHRPVNRDEIRAVVLEYTNRVEGPTLRLEGQGRPEVEEMTDRLMGLIE